MNKKIKPQKVAHILCCLNVGGAERFVIDLSTVQKSLGMSPTIVSLGSSKDVLIAECLKNKVSVITAIGNSLTKMCHCFIVLQKFDVIHIHSPHGLKFLRYILPLLKKKVIYTRHGAKPFNEKIWLAFHKKIKPFVSAVTFVSKEGQNIFLNNHQWESTPHQVIDNGVIIKDNARQTTSNKILRIGSVGRMVPLKNQIGLLKAVKCLDNSDRNNIELHFFGDGKCLDELKHFHQESIPDVKVNFHGMVNDRDYIYSSFDLLIVTSETEGLSMVIIEAMANRIPVIASDVGGNPKLVIHEKTGWLFNYDDEHMLREYIQKVIVDRTLVNSVGKSAFFYIKDNFSITSAAKKYAELYES